MTRDDWAVRRRFIQSEGSPNRFWEIWLNGDWVPGPDHTTLSSQELREFELIAIPSADGNWYLKTAFDS